MNKHLNAIRKTGFGSLFTPTKAMSRVRAIATDRTQSSLTGGCFEPGIIRISTEFCGAEGEPDPLGATGPGNVRIRTPSRTCRGGGRPIAFGGCRPATRIRSFFETRQPCKCASIKTSLSRISRFARRGVHATV